MPFKKLSKTQYPPRLWALVGYPGSGKSTFATQMRGPLLPIDADHRFVEVAALADGDVYELSQNPDDHNSTDSIAAILEENMPGSGIQTIVVDSLTAIIAPLVMKAVRDNDAGKNKNRAAAFKDKATAMRQLQFSVNRWGCDVLWIYHLQDGRDNKANEVTTATLPKTERNRLHSSLNMELHLLQDAGRRGVKVVWARRGRDGMTLWDDTGTWAGMPERIESAVYDGLTEADQERIEREPPPAHFANPEAAIQWAMTQGAFDEFHHAQNAYDKLKQEKKPKSAKAMRDLWVADVESRNFWTFASDNKIDKQIANDILSEVGGDFEAGLGGLKTWLKQNNPAVKTKPAHWQPPENADALDDWFPREEDQPVGEEA